MGTFSKAFGSFGAFLAGSAESAEWMVSTARSFIFSTALPPCVIAASIAALDLIELEPRIIDRLWENRRKTAVGITAAGFDVTPSETPIIPLRTGDIQSTLRAAQHLLDHGIFAPAIRPPAVKEPRLRITITAAHSDEDIDKLIEALKKFEKQDPN